MSQLTITRTSSFHRTLRSSSAVPLSFRFGKFFLLFSMMFFIGLLSFSYLVKFTEIQTKGYQLSKLEMERDQLTRLQEEQGMRISQLKSLEEIRSSTIASTMVPSKPAVFIREGSGIAQLPRTGNRP